jgi:hypothetical protein
MGDWPSEKPESAPEHHDSEQLTQGAFRRKRNGHRSAVARAVAAFSNFPANHGAWPSTPGQLYTTSLIIGKYDPWSLQRRAQPCSPLAPGSAVPAADPMMYIE